MNYTLAVIPSFLKFWIYGKFRYIYELWVSCDPPSTRTGSRNGKVQEYLQIWIIPWLPYTLFILFNFEEISMSCDDSVVK
jgi:hypothetical protein